MPLKITAVKYNKNAINLFITVPGWYYISIYRQRGFVNFYGDIMIKQAEVHWNLTDVCNKGCSYCPSKYSGNTLTRGIDEYQAVIRKLQASRYQHAETIKWKLGGGEPLQFPGLDIILADIKKKPSHVRLDTNGGETWFDLMPIINMVDHIKFTQHSWQNPSVLDFVVDLCKDNNVKLDIVIPLMPGKILEDRARIEELTSQGFAVHEQILTREAVGGHDYWSGYSNKDINLINGRPEDWTPPEPVLSEFDQPQPVWIDPRIIQNPEFVYTGRQCFAGVDYIFISGRGWASASACGGRDLGNVFVADWAVPASSFPCSMFQCSHESDRTRIRVL